MLITLMVGIIAVANKNCHFSILILHPFLTIFLDFQLGSAVKELSVDAINFGDGKILSF